MRQVARRCQCEEIAEDAGGLMMTAFIIFSGIITLAELIVLTGHVRQMAAARRRRRKHPD